MVSRFNVDFLPSLNFAFSLVGIFAFDIDVLHGACWFGYSFAPRYLAPCEIARLHGFPATFAFPPTVSRKKQFELLGNSLSVDCVAALLRFMLADAAHNESHVGSAVSGGCAALADTDALEG